MRFLYRLDRIRHWHSLQAFSLDRRLLPILTRTPAVFVGIGVDRAASYRQADAMETAALAHDRRLQGLCLFSTAQLRADFVVPTLVGDQADEIAGAILISPG